MSDSCGMTPDIAAQLVHLLDHSASTVFLLLDEHLRIQWISESSRWITGADAHARLGSSALQGIHPGDVDRLLDGVETLRAAGGADDRPTSLQPARFRFQRFDDQTWIVMEVIAHNVVGDSSGTGLLVSARPVDGGPVDVGHVIDLLAGNAPLPEILAACAGLVPDYLGSAAVVALIGDNPIIGAQTESPAAQLATDPRWWEGAVRQNESLWPKDLRGLPDDLANQARDKGFHTTWVTPVHDHRGDVIGCVVLWVRDGFRAQPWHDGALRPTERLASLVIDDELRRKDLATRPW